MHTELSIVLVEDNEQLREEMVDFLNRPGWRAHGVDCGEELNQWLESNQAHIAVLDVNLPYEDGYSIATRLRELYPAMGVVMLSARVRPMDRASGYQAGADVYLTKPTNAAELSHVIANLGRRVVKDYSGRHFYLDRDTGTLLHPDGQQCVLSPIELKFIELLALSPGRQAETDFILDSFNERGGRTLSRETLAVMISRLRTKIKSALGVENLVAAHRGYGYRLNLPLRLDD